MSAVRYITVLNLICAFLSLTRANPDYMDRFEPDICVKEYRENEYYFGFCGALIHDSCSAGCGCEADERIPSVPNGYCYQLGAVEPPPFKIPCWLLDDGSGIYCGGTDSHKCPEGCECVTDQNKDSSGVGKCFRQTLSQSPPNARNLCWHPNRDGIRKCNESDLRPCPMGCECVIIADLADACLSL